MMTMAARSSYAFGQLGDLPAASLVFPVVVFSYLPVAADRDKDNHMPASSSIVRSRLRRSSLRILKGLFKEHKGRVHFIGQHASEQIPEICCSRSQCSPSVGDALENLYTRPHMGHCADPAGISSSATCSETCFMMIRRMRRWRSMRSGSFFCTAPS